MKPPNEPLPPPPPPDNHSSSSSSSYFSSAARHSVLRSSGGSRLSACMRSMMGPSSSGGRGAPGGCGAARQKGSSSDDMAILQHNKSLGISCGCLNISGEKKVWGKKHKHVSSCSEQNAKDRIPTTASMTPVYFLSLLKK